ncbi:hypothetical protein [Flavobacterium sp. PS2]|uniref:hypothetical protein n=1 Tax=Flavobacterium sp. PS2 TaxID=3384157 RepID=UPI00390C632C
MPINLSDFPEKTIYTMYYLHYTTAKALESKPQLNDEEILQLDSARAAMHTIEIYSANKRSEGFAWSLPSLFQFKGWNPTFTLEFYPGTESYEKYGKTLVVNVRYSEEDLKYIIETLRTNGPRINSKLKVLKIHDFTEDEINTGDIYTAG